jgi:pimeloyl-ACP methyl ester carboxylesterase
MPYVNHQGVRLHYQVEGDGPPLVLQHGLTSCIQSWYVYGYVASLQQAYRLVLIDARGHGASDKPHEPKDYELRLRVADVLAVLDALHLDTVHYMGYSMGGRIGFGIAQYAPERLHSLIIGGMNATGSGGVATQERVDLLKQGMVAYVAHTETQSGPIDPARQAWLLANDPEALIAATLAPRGLDRMEEVLPTMTMPCLLYVGEADGFFPGAKVCAQHMPNATFVSFPGLDHGQTSRASHLVLPHVTEFLKRAVLQASKADSQ